MDDGAQMRGVLNEASRSCPRSAYQMRYPATAAGGSPAASITSPSSGVSALQRVLAVLVGYNSY